MRDRDAERKANETVTMLTTVAELLPRVRRNLIAWASGGYPAGNGESSTGSDRHSDPTARAVTATEIVNPQGRRIGWRDIDPFNERRKQLDDKLADIHRRARDLERDIRDLAYHAEAAGDDGCELCAAARQPINTTSGKAEHECSPSCAKNDHRHPNGWQRIHSRTAPKYTDPELVVLSRARCKFHYDFAERYAIDTHADITLWHLDRPGQRVPLTMIKTHHPDAFDRHHAART